MKTVGGSLEAGTMGSVGWNVSRKEASEFRCLTVSDILNDSSILLLEYWA